MKNNSIHRSYFTLVELLVSMGVFSLIMLSLLTLFNSSQKIWARSTAKDSLYSNARVALDLLTYDIQCALINNDADLKGKYPFWLRKDNQINMITATPYSGDGVSNICEVKYALADDDADTETFPMDVTPAENVDETKGWLVRSCTNDQHAGYDFDKYLSVTNSFGDAPVPNRAQKIWGNNPQDMGTSDYWQRVIPYVVDLKFTCYYKNPNYSTDGKYLRALEPIENPSTDTTTTNPSPTLIDKRQIHHDVTTVSPPITNPMNNLVAVKVELELMDKTSWTKWKAMPAGATKDGFRDEKKMKFSKIIFIEANNQQ